MEMNEIHDAVWEFLIKKNQQNPDLRFILRSGNRHERLEKGYWFYGNDDYLTVSFWNAFNNVGKNIPDDARSPIISFIISQNGKCNLRFYYETNSTTIPLFEDLSKALGMEKNELHEKTVKVTETKSWSKNYNKLNGNKTPQYLDYLEYFLSFEKPVIDAFLRVHDEQKVLFPDIDAKKFRESIQSIERWRATQNIGSYKNLNDALQNALKPSVLILKNIGRFDELRIDFSKQVTCFIGNNGCGKSTILKALALSFTGVYPFKQERNGLPPNEKYILKLKNLLRINKAGTKSHYSSSGLIELYYNVNTIDTHNRITFSPSSIDDDLEAERPIFLLNKGDILLTHLIVGFAQQVTEIKQSVIRLASEPIISDIESLVFNLYDASFFIIRQWIIELTSPEIYVTDEEKEQNRFVRDKIFEVISDITGDKIELIQTDDSFDYSVRTVQNPQGIPLSLVSQGYKNVIGWIGFFMKRLWEYGKIVLPEEDFTKLPAICMIDEIDTYLHPTWQHRILAGLVKHFPNVRFIITSHSPYVLSSVPSDKIDILWIDAEKSEITRLEDNIFGADANRATEEIRGTIRPNTEGGENIDVLISKVYSLIESNNIEAAEMILTEKLGQIDPFLDLDIVRINRLINMKKRTLNTVNL